MQGAQLLRKEHEDLKKRVELLEESNAQLTDELDSARAKISDQAAQLADHSRSLQDCGPLLTHQRLATSRRRTETSPTSRNAWARWSKQLASS